MIIKIKNTKKSLILTFIFSVGIFLSFNNLANAFDDCSDCDIVCVPSSEHFDLPECGECESNYCSDLSPNPSADGFVDDNDCSDGKIPNNTNTACVCPSTHELGSDNQCYPKNNNMPETTPGTPPETTPGIPPETTPGTPPGVTPIALAVTCPANFDPIGGVCFPKETGLSDASIFVILSNMFDWLIGIFIALAIIAFVISGMQYLLAAGNADLATAAKKNALNSVIGIIIGLSGFIIMQAIATALTGESYFF